MELTDLKYFYNVATARSFSQGARISHVSPPAISKSIKKLEEELEETKEWVQEELDALEEEDLAAHSVMEDVLSQPAA